MSKISAEFHNGWWPSADAINAPPGSMLRADNLFKSGNALVARPGIMALLPASETSGRCRSMFSANVASKNVAIMQFNDGDMQAAEWGVTGDVPNPSTVTTRRMFFAGGPDVAYGSYMDQIFMAQVSNRARYASGASSSLPNWGVQTKYDPPTLSAEAQVTATVATCDQAEAPGFAASEGAITAAYPTGADGTTANGAIEVTPAATSRSTITKVFSADTDLLNFGSVDGGDSDLFDMLVWVAEPKNLQTITVMFGLVGVTGDPFQSDYYYFDFRVGGARQGTVDIKSATSIGAEVSRIISTAADISAPVEVAEAPIPDRVSGIKDNIERLPTGDNIRSRERKDMSGSVGWFHLTVPRGQFNRVGQATGKNWTVVKAFRIVTVASTGTDKLRFDTIRFVGDGQAALTGTFRVKIQPVVTDGAYEDRGQPSDPSDEITLFQQRLKVTIPKATYDALDADDHVGKFNIMVYGGYLDRYYKAGEVSVPAPTATTNTILAKSEAQMLVDNIVLDVCQPPPTNIVDIDGPYKFRLFCLTFDGHVYPSQRRRPGTFNYSHAIKIGDSYTNRSLWIKKTTLGIYVGTSKDIYIITGDGEESDGIANFRVDSLNVTDPPVDKCAAGYGNTIFYRGANGFFRIDGGSVRRLPMDRVEALFKEDRHGVRMFSGGRGRMSNITDDGLSEVNYRMAVKDNKLYICDGNSYPLGALPGTDMTRMLVHTIDTDEWELYTFPIPINCLAKSPDGLLLFGSGSDNGTSATMWGVFAYNNVYTSEWADQRTRKDQINGVYYTIGLYGLWPSLGGLSNYKNLLDTVVAYTCDEPDTFSLGLRLDNNNSGNLYEQINPVPTLDPGLEPTVYPTKNLLHHVASSSTPPFRTVQPVLYRNAATTVDTSPANFAFHTMVMNVRDRPELRMQVTTGYLNLEAQEAVWVREIRALIWSEVNLTLEIVFDDNTSDPSYYTVTITVTPGVTTLYKIPLPKECSGYACIINIKSSGDKVDRLSYENRTGNENKRFECYWIEAWRSSTGKDGSLTRVARVEPK